MANMVFHSGIGSTYILTVMVGLTGAAKELAPQQVAVILQKGQVEVTEKLHMLVLHSQLLRRVPVDHLHKQDRETHRR